MAATGPRLADLNAGEWNEHSRFKGFAMKSLLTQDELLTFFTPPLT
jgi:hypothetical protein